MSRTIHKLAGGRCVLSEENVGWLPGSFADEKAAQLAITFPRAILQALQDKLNEREPDPERRYITVEMLEPIP